MGDGPFRAGPDLYCVIHVATYARAKSWAQLPLLAFARPQSRRSSRKPAPRLIESQVRLQKNHLKRSAFDPGVISARDPVLFAFDVKLQPVEAHGTNCIVAAGPLPSASRLIVLRQVRARSNLITGIHTASVTSWPLRITTLSP